MKKLIAVVLAINVSISMVSAQKGQHSVLVGVDDYQLADSFILSSAAKGKAMGVGYTFGRSSSVKKDHFAVGWSRSVMENIQFDVSTHNFTFRYAQAFSLLKNRSGSFNSFWGYSLQSAPGFIKATNKDQSRSSWNTTNNLSIYQSAEFIKGQNKWILDIHIPVMGLSSRPDETSSRNSTVNGSLYDSYSNLFVTSWLNQKAVSASLEFNTAWNNKFRFFAGARYQYLSSNEDYMYRNIVKGLYAGFSWH